MQPVPPDDVRADKDALRAAMRAVRGALDPAALEAAGHAIADRVMALPALAAPRVVSVYRSVRREVPTAGLIDRLRRAGHAVVVPRVTGPTSLEMCAVDGAEVAGVLGIPTTDGPVVDAVDLVVCPGLAFDLDGARLGYGAGYYDRWLAAHPAVIPVGIAIDAAVVPRVPTDGLDRRMSAVITPTRSIAVAGGWIRVVAGAWIVDGRVFAAQRGPGRGHAGRWELPGGKVEAGESDAVALARELREELGLTVTVGARIGSGRVDGIELVAYAVTTSDAPRPTEHAALRWLGPDELDAVDWAPADR
ncbi:MAG: 5-formyltetrahydrofolate cyclo-ligase, partial [Myxococcota bacterium]